MKQTDKTQKTSRSETTREATSRVKFWKPPNALEAPKLQQVLYIAGLELRSWDKMMLKMSILV